MRYELKIYADTPEELARLLLTIEDNKNCAVPLVPSQVKKPVADKTSSAIAEETEKKVSILAEVTFEGVKEALVSISRNKGRQAAVDILAHFGVAKIPELKPEKYKEFMEKAEIVLKD